MQSPGNSSDGIGTGGSATTAARAGWAVAADSPGYPQRGGCEAHHDGHAASEPGDWDDGIRHLARDPHLVQKLESDGLGECLRRGGLNYL